MKKHKFMAVVDMIVFVTAITIMLNHAFPWKGIDWHLILGIIAMVFF